MRAETREKSVLKAEPAARFAGVSYRGAVITRENDPFSLFHLREDEETVTRAEQTGQCRYIAAADVILCSVASRVANVRIMRLDCAESPPPA